MKKLFRGRIRWVLVGWMFAISAVAYLDRVNISIAGSSIEHDFGLTHVQLGWVFSASSHSDSANASTFDPEAIATYWRPPTR